MSFLHDLLEELTVARAHLIWREVLLNLPHGRHRRWNGIVIGGVVDGRWHCYGHGSTVRRQALSGNLPMKSVDASTIPMRCDHNLIAYLTTQMAEDLVLLVLVDHGTI